MNISSLEVSATAEVTSKSDRLKDLKVFDDTKAGLKGLVDLGIVNDPKIFIRPPDELAERLNSTTCDLQGPIIDLSGSEIESRRKEIVDQVTRASSEWSFFQMVNHGVPTSLLESMIDGIRMFHEQDVEIISNDRFKSVQHRVLANHVGPRISAECLFNGATVPPRTYVPIKELISEECPPLYKEFVDLIIFITFTPSQSMSLALMLLKYEAKSGRNMKANLVHYYFPRV